MCRCTLKAGPEKAARKSLGELLCCVVLNLCDFCDFFLLHNLQKKFPQKIIPWKKNPQKFTISPIRPSLQNISFPIALSRGKNWVGWAMGKKTFYVDGLKQNCADI